MSQKKSGAGSKSVTFHSHGNDPVFHPGESHFVSPHKGGINSVVGTVFASAVPVHSPPDAMETRLHESGGNGPIGGKKGR